MSAVSEDAKKYEVMIIFNPDLADGAIEDSFEKIKQQIKGVTGEICLEQQLGRRSLASSIGNHSWGVYYLVNFYAQPEKMHELHEHLRLDVDVIRYMILNVPAQYEPKINFEEAQVNQMPRQKKIQYSEPEPLKKTEIRVEEKVEKTSEEAQPIEEKSPRKRTLTSAEDETVKSETETKPEPSSEGDELEQQIKRILDSKDLKSKI